MAIITLEYEIMVELQWSLARFETLEINIKSWVFKFSQLCYISQQVKALSPYMYFIISLMAISLHF